MFIQTETTPNPATLKFIPGREVSEKPYEFQDKDSAQASPLATNLFTLKEVKSVFFGHDFISVTKSSGEWDYIKPSILGMIMQHFMSGSPLVQNASEVQEDEEEFFDVNDEVIVQTIKELLDTRIRPAVAGDGGDITFRGYRDGVVYLVMKGACSGCPSSTVTLQHGIQNLLQHFIPDVVEVRPV